MNWESVGRRIKAARARKGYTQEQLAERVNEKKKRRILEVVRVLIDSF